MDSPLHGIILPDLQIRFHIQCPHPVRRRHIQLPDRAVVRFGISRRHDDPSLRDPVISEHLVLEKLQHGGSQRLRHTVDLINKKDPLPISRALFIFIDGAYDLAHGVFRHGIFRIPESLCHQLRQPHRALSRMVGDGICHQPGPALLRCLLHDRRLADPRRPHQKHRSLTHRRDPPASSVILRRIRAYGAYDLFLCLPYVHLPVSTSISRVRVCAQTGPLPLCSSSFKNTNAVS